MCTDFASLSHTANVHRPAEQVFTLEEDDDREEEMFAVVDRQQWNTRRAAEPPLSPELQQMFTLARRMSYEMRPIARRLDAPRQSGEAIVVGAIGSAAPWFLTGWAHDVEIEFMIDTGCQVTILSMTVFERMCVVDPTVRSKLRPCRRRLVSADSSPLMVQGQLELAIVFPGLCCDMLFVVANIGSDGLLGTEALQSYLPHQLDLRTGQLWADGWSTLQLHQQRLTPELDGDSSAQ